MILVDTALKRRYESGNPVRVGLIGAGFSGTHIAHQIIRSVPGLRLVAISNRSLTSAENAYRKAGISDLAYPKTRSDLEDAISAERYAVTNDPELLCAAEGVDVIIETTGTIDFGARVVVSAFANGKHVVAVNAELDATLGPALQARATRAGVVYSNCDGDEPGAAMNLIRFVRGIGLKVKVAGNLKGLYDPYRNPDTQKEFADRLNQDPARIASYADGTKLSMEICVLANATGFPVAKRGMYGPALDDVNQARDYYRDKLADSSGLVDFLVGAAPGSGVFVIATTEDPMTADYLEYLKMGAGPLYVFYRPFHLPQLEAPMTAARAVLFSDAAVAPLGAPVCDAVTVAKRDLNPGEVLDGLGGFCCYGLLDNYRSAVLAHAVPIGLSQGCRVKRFVKKDMVVTVNDVVSPVRPLVDELRSEQLLMYQSDEKTKS